MNGLFSLDADTGEERPAPPQFRHPRKVRATVLRDDPRARAYRVDFGGDVGPHWLPHSVAVPVRAPAGPRLAEGDSVLFWVPRWKLDELGVPRAAREA